MIPADTGTKWNVSELYPPEMWFNGPDFIHQTEETWPIEPKDVSQVNEEILELRCNLTTQSGSDSLRPDINRFSSLIRLINTQAYILRYFYRTNVRGDATKEERQDAFTYLVRSVQLEYYKK